jgi:hypothetical protein
VRSKALSAAPAGSMTRNLRELSGNFSSRELRACDWVAPVAAWSFDFPQPAAPSRAGIKSSAAAR